jgi:hypothetical protein
MRLVSILLILLSGILGCVDPISLKVQQGAGALVVDGMITDEPGAFIVKLSRSIAFDNSQVLRVYPVPETGATLRISDDKGSWETGVEIDPGQYLFSFLKGTVGNSYVLDITTSDGKQYRSGEEQMQPAIKPERTEYEFKFYQNAIVSTTRGTAYIPLDAFFMYAIVNDPPEKGNFHLWQAEGTFEFFSFTDHDTLKQCWAPHPGRLETGIELSDDIYTNGKTNRQFVCVVPYNRISHFLVNMKQMSLTERAYEYWRASKNQHTTTGSLMDPPPAAIRGNIYNVADDELVLGYFGASSVIRTNHLLNRWHDAGLKPPAREIPIRPGNCKLQEPGATNKKPAGF